jgi:DNA-binding transcriptional MocR family regulator
VSGQAAADLVDVQWLARRLAEGDAQTSLAEIIASAIEAGELGRGVRLPTIRELSAGTGLGFRAISEAWTQLRNSGLIETRRRGGSFVTVPDAMRGADGPRPSGGDLRVDLAKSAADLTLLPDIGQAIEFGLRAPNLHSSVREFITPRLRDAARTSWPFDAEAFIACGSGAEAVLLAVLGVTAEGATVAVDEPANPGLLGSLRTAGLRVVGVTADANGPVPKSLAAALDAGATTYLFQASVPYTRGAATTPVRLRALARVLAAHADTMVVEEDAAGPLAASTPLSFGNTLDGRVVHVRSFCKSYGVDLRTSLIGGAREAVDAIQAKRSTGLAVTSRILQNALAFLIDSPDTAVLMSQARARYGRRKAECIAALDRHGVSAVSGPDGQFIWIDVADEVGTILDLASEGMTVGAGSECYAEGISGSIRVATMRLPDEPDLVEQIAETVATVIRQTAVSYYV